MGIEVNVFKGEGIAIFTKDLVSKTIKELKENELSLCDCLDQGWVFISLGAKRDKYIERGINCNNQRDEFNPQKKEIPSTLIPLFLDEWNEYIMTKKRIDDTLDYLSELYNKGETKEEYNKLRKILDENKDSWIPGEYMVIIYN